MRPRTQRILQIESLTSATHPLDPIVVYIGLLIDLVPLVRPQAQQLILSNLCLEI